MGFLPIAGALLAGALWGMLNRDRRNQQPPDEPEESWGQGSTVGESRYRITATSYIYDGFQAPCNLNQRISSQNPNAAWSAWGKFSALRGRRVGGAGRCGGTTNYEVRVVTTSGAESNALAFTSGDGLRGHSFSAQWEFRNGAVRDSRAPQPAPSPLPLPKPPPPLPLQSPDQEELPDPAAPTAPPLPMIPTVPTPRPSLPPNPEPLPLPAPSPSPSPSPPPAPSIPPATPKPSTPTAPTPSRQPNPVGPQPGRDGRPDPTRNPDGTPVRPEPVPQTDPEVEFFLGVPIGQPSQRPPATPEGTAAELGRLEQKLRIIGSQPGVSGPEAPPPVDLGPIQAQLDLIMGELEEIKNRPDPVFPEIPACPEIPPCPEFPEIPPPVDLGPIQAQLVEVLADLEIIKNRPDPDFPDIPACPEFPEIPPAPDLGPIQEQLEEILSELETIKNRPDPDFPEIPDPPDLGPLEAKVQRLVDEVFREFDGDSYELQPPCDFDSSGDPKEADVATWQAGEGRFLQLARQIDAVALLLQYHKDQRQPTCAKGGRQGEPVTVLFEQVI